MQKAFKEIEGFFDARFNVCVCGAFNTGLAAAYLDGGRWRQSE
jgi:hypothetical protein